MYLATTSFQFENKKATIMNKLIKHLIFPFVAILSMGCSLFGIRSEE